MSTCAVCRAELVATDWGELCAACALDAGLGSDQVRIGDYERFHLLGEGSMGAVYLAKHVASDDMVALKLAKADLLERPGGLALFQQQAKTESALVHPHILHVQAVGTHQGRPFMIMPLMEGGTLADAANRARLAEPSARLGLLLKLARAVRFAHARGVLHCDLKPDNILFDAENEPKVCDFGMARQIGDGGVSASDGVQGGTRGWMSPEQVRGEALTTASDVFALGVLMYWLDKGQLPFGEGQEFETRVLEQPAPALRSWTPELGWGLEAIACRALRKNPDSRYGSAAALVEDLERLEATRPLRAGSTPFWGRAWYWAQRHKGARNALSVLLPAFAAITLYMAAVQRAELRRAVLDMNAYAASGQAATVLYQLKEYADVIEQAAADPAVQALTHGPRRAQTAAGGSPCQLQTSLEDPAGMARYAGKFSTLFVLDADGCSRARISEEPTREDYVRTTYDWHDYFSGASKEAALPRQETTSAPTIALMSETPTVTSCDFISPRSVHDEDAVHADYLAGVGGAAPAYYDEGKLCFCVPDRLVAGKVVDLVPAAALRLRRRALHAAPRPVLGANLRDTRYIAVQVVRLDVDRCRVGHRHAARRKHRVVGDLTIHSTVGFGRRKVAAVLARPPRRGRFRIGKHPPEERRSQAHHNQ